VDALAAIEPYQAAASAEDDLDLGLDLDRDLPSDESASDDLDRDQLKEDRRKIRAAIHPRKLLVLTSARQRPQLLRSGLSLLVPRPMAVTQDVLGDVRISLQDDAAEAMLAPAADLGPVDHGDDAIGSDDQSDEAIGSDDEAIGSDDEAIGSDDGSVDSDIAIDLS
jgi:hypothetical protein